MIGICPVCRRNVYFLEEHEVDGSDDYHPHCWIKHACHKIDKLEKKADKKDITLEEAQNMTELKTMLQKAVMDKNPKKNKIPKKYESLITNPQLRESSLHSNIEKEIKRTDTLRLNRWAWETFNTIENQILITGYEQKQIGDGNDTM